MEIKIKLEDNFIDIGGKLCDLIGWRGVIGQIYVLLYISDKPLTLDNIAKRINVSRSTVWSAIKKLQQLCAVNTQYIKELKRDGYAAERDLNIIFRNGIIPALNAKLVFVESYLKQLENLLDQLPQKNAEENVKELAGYYEFIDKFKRQKDDIAFLLKQVLPQISLNGFESGEKDLDTGCK